MKLTFFAAMAALTILASCTDAPKADSADTQNAQTVNTATSGTPYHVDFSQSSIEWIGTKPTGRHHGTLKLKDGVMMVENNMITGGKFAIDIKSLQPDDQDDAGNTKLKTHLLSADFFDAEKYPDATFEITQVNNSNGSNENVAMKDATHTITGNFTMHGVTKSISFPARLMVDNKVATADANFNIDRTQWNMNYQSDKSIQDKFIDKEVNLKLHVVANPQ